MKALFDKLVDLNERQLKKIAPIVSQINSLEGKISAWEDKDFAEKTKSFREEVAAASDPAKKLEELLPLAYAMVREVAVRTVGLRAYDVQLIGGIVGHQGKIFEQKTGEGKTLTSTLPLYLNSLRGEAVHSITVNDFLAKRDMGWNAPIFHLLGVSVASLVHDGAVLYDPEYTDESATDFRMKHLRDIPREEAYKADITYGTNSEFGFDYLRDNMVKDLTRTVQRGHYFALIDEVDSVLIDEARTPLIISAPAEEAVDRYLQFASLARGLQPETDYETDEKQRTVNLTEIGVRKIERQLGVDNLYEKDFETLHHIENSLKASTLFRKDKDYVVREGELILVDEFTGRLMVGRRYSEGLHQALEAKEGLQIQRESRTLATITIQNYFRLYEKLSGMTGTAKTEEEEFYKIYGLEVVVVPTNRPVARRDHKDIVYKTVAAKYAAVAAEIEKYNERGQPVLVGTTSIEKNELLHDLLKRRGINHNMLNAKNHEHEAEIVANAGKLGAVTLATNIAGRGVDIELGGAGPKKHEGEEWPEERIKAWEEEHQKVLDLGGLHVIGTERHESRRIDNQLRGRSGRQGDNGSSRFFVSLQDDLMRIFGGDRIAGLMDSLKIDDNVPIENNLISRTIESSQKRVEGLHFDQRKRVVEYDDVNNIQREIIYAMRHKVLNALVETDDIDDADLEFKEWMLKKVAPYQENADDLWDEKEKELGKDLFYKVVQQITIDTIDVLWMDTIDVLTHLRQDVGLRAYGQRDPVVEYKKEARALFDRLVADVFATVVGRIKRLNAEVEEVDMSKTPKNMTFSHPNAATPGVATPQKPVTVRNTSEKVGRNDPCPCGSGKKYKQCGLINAPEHKG